MPDNNPTAPVATTQTPVESGTSTQGSVSATPAVTNQTNQGVATPSYKQEEVETWKKGHETYSNLSSFLNQNPDLLEAIDNRINGRGVTQTPNPTQTQTAQATPAPQSVDPLLNNPIVRNLMTQVQSLTRERTREQVDREIADTQNRFPFLGGDEGRKKLDAAYIQYGNGKLQELISQGVPINEAKAQVNQQLDNLPLDYFVFQNFRPELQDFLVKSKTGIGGLPPGIGSRGDRVNQGQPGLTPGFEEQAVKAYREASSQGNEAQSQVVGQVAQQMGYDPNDVNALLQLQESLRRGTLKISGG